MAWRAALLPPRPCPPKLLAVDPQSRTAGRDPSERAPPVWSSRELSGIQPAWLRGAMQAQRGEKGPALSRPFMGPRICGGRAPSRPAGKTRGCSGAGLPWAPRIWHAPAWRCLHSAAKSYSSPWGTFLHTRPARLCLGHTARPERRAPRDAVWMQHPARTLAPPQPRRAFHSTGLDNLLGDRQTRFWGGTEDCSS